VHHNGAELDLDRPFDPVAIRITDDDMNAAIPGPAGSDDVVDAADRRPVLLQPRLDAPDLVD